MLATNIMMTLESTSAPVNGVEWLSMRIGFSTYSGWVTAAVILQVTYLFKSWGLVGRRETTYTIIMLWIAYGAYNAFAYVNRNPMYGTVFIWVCAAIRAKQFKHDAIRKNVTIIGCL